MGKGGRGRGRRGRKDFIPVDATTYWGINQLSRVKVSVSTVSEKDPSVHVAVTVTEVEGGAERYTGYFIFCVFAGYTSLSGPITTGSTARK